MKIRVLIISTVVLLFSCSHQKEVVKDRSYAFDLIEYEENSSTDSLVFRAEPDSIKLNKTKDIPEKLYYIQLGAFVKKTHAERFIKLYSNLIKEKMILSYSQRVNYYVVQLPPYKDREAAYNKLKAIRNNKAFEDAFIITVQN